MSLKIIQKYKILAKKSLGQNFLMNNDILDEIVDIIPVTWNNIIEVWPGYGALSEKLLEKKPRSLHLVELDKDMIYILEDRIQQWELYTWEIDFQIYNQDVLDFFPKFQIYSLIANIPYYITSPILRHFLYDVENPPKKMIILMQKDVWDKILWKWKNKSSVLSLMIEKKCKVREEIFVGKENFIPQPKVESSVLSFETYDIYDDIDDKKFLELIRAWFSSPRKKLIKNLIWAWFDKEKVRDFLCQQWRDENMRGEDGDIYFWIELFQTLL